MTQGGDETQMESVQYACRGAGDTVDQQLEKIYREDQKAVKMVRVNLIVLGILASSLSFLFQGQGVDPQQFLNAHNAVGFVLILASTLLASISYATSSFELGVGPDAIDNALQMDNDEFFEKIANQYSDWVEENRKVHRKNAAAIEYVISLAIVGITFVVGGFAIGFLTQKGTSWSYGLLAGEVLVGLVVARLIGNSDSALETFIGDQS